MKKLLTVLSAIAGFSITQYLLNSLGFNSEWWTFLVLAIFTGIFTWLFTELCNKFRIANAIFSTGIALLFFMTVIPLFEKYEFVAISVLFVLVAIPTELLANRKLRLGDFILDPIIAVSTALLIQKINISLLNPLILFAAFALIIILDISIKRAKSEQKEEVTEVEKPHNGKIDIEM